MIFLQGGPKVEVTPLQQCEHKYHYQRFLVQRLLMFLFILFLTIVAYVFK